MHHFPISTAITIIVFIKFSTKKKVRKIGEKKLAMHRPEKKVNYLVHLGKYRPHDGDEISLVSEVNKPKDPLKLLKTNNSGCSTHEAHYRRM
jgi:hypothetical protein